MVYDRDGKWHDLIMVTMVIIIFRRIFNIEEKLFIQ